MSDETKFTKGDWVVGDHQARSVFHKIGDEHHVIARCGGFTFVQRPAQEEAANAHLIAAAPDLYDELDCRVGDLFMLRRAIEEGDPKAELLVRIDDMLRETRAALSKARGESQ